MADVRLRCDSAKKHDNALWIGLRGILRAVFATKLLIRPDYLPRYVPGRTGTLVMQCTGPSCGHNSNICENDFVQDFVAIMTLQISQVSE